MTEPATAEIRQLLDEEALRAWIAQQRWFGSKRRSITGIEVVEGVSLHDDPVLYLALVQTRFAAGTHELYQLPLGMVRSGVECGPECIAASEDWTVYDALAEPTELLELMRRIDEGLQIETETGRFSFHVASEPANLGDGATRPRRRRRAVELLDRFRRPFRAEGVPQARTGHQPRTRDVALSHQTGVSEHRSAGGVVRIRRRGVHLDARRQPGVPHRRARWLGHGARPARIRPRRAAGAPRLARQGHRGAAQRTRHRCAPIRRSRPSSQARRRWRC